MTKKTIATLKRVSAHLPQRPPKDTKSFIASFGIAGQRYEHNIFCSDDDRVELTRGDGTLILTYTAQSIVVKPDGETLGRFAFENNECRNWVFLFGENKILFGPDLIKAEVVLSKHYLNGYLTTPPNPAVFVQHEGQQ